MVRDLEEEVEGAIYIYIYTYMNYEIKEPVEVLNDSI